MFFNKKITVGIICYNRKEYIRECLDSILSQSVNKEVIVIDDCSNDGTYEILKEYIAKGVHIYRNDKNKGTVYTRLRCMKKAKGDYLLMVDADDKLIDNSLEKLYNEATKEKADILEFSVDGDGSNYLYKYRKTKFEGDLLEEYRKGAIGNTLCNKLISKCVYKKVYEKLKDCNKQANYSDVLMILYSLLSEAKTLNQTSIIGYYYFGSRGMTSNLTEIEKFENYCGFGNAYNYLLETYGDSKCLHDKWNYVCNQAVVSYLNLSKKEQEEYKYTLNRLMPVRESEHLIEEISKILDQKVLID